ncbi:MAG: c-type cytochrome, partial [Ardenticatenaceae bacterium]|nr:c-type cytochrome [Ardenticatenaceae bacterium]
MNKYNFISFFGFLALVVIFPIYAWYEPSLREVAQDDLQNQYVTEASIIYVENCAVCHGIEGEGIGATPALNVPALQTAAYEDLFKVIARGRYGTAMTGWHEDEGGLYNDYQIQQLVALIRYADWTQIGELAASQGLIPPTLPIPSVDPEMVAQIEAMSAEAGSEWAAGFQLYASNCTVCHGIEGEGSDLGLPLNTADIQSRDADELIRIISEGVSGTAMVPWRNALTLEEIESIVGFLQHWDEIEAEGVVLTPPEPVWVDVDDPESMLELGERIYSTTCVACHGEEGSGGTGPVLNSQQVLTANTDEQLRSTIINGGWRPNSTMPSFGDRLTSVEIDAIVSYLRAWEPTAPFVENPRGTEQGGGPPWLRTDDGTTTTPGGGGQGQGNQGNGQGQGGPAWRDSGSPPGQSNQGNGTTETPATTEQGPTIAVQGTVAAIENNMLTVQIADGTQVEA